LHLFPRATEEVVDLRPLAEGIGDHHIIARERCGEGAQRKCLVCMEWYECPFESSIRPQEFGDGLVPVGDPAGAEVAHRGKVTAALVRCAKNR
jgi:hypothetical protein